MTHVLDIALGVSIPMKVGWGVVFIWAVVQIAWWRHGRVVVLPPMPPSPPRRARIRMDADTGHADHGAAPV